MSCKPCEEKAAEEAAKANKLPNGEPIPLNNPTISSSSNNVISIMNFPEYVGGYDITGRYKEGDSSYTIVFSYYHKPPLINRFFCKILLGWVWIDYKIKK